MDAFGRSTKSLISDRLAAGLGVPQQENGINTSRNADTSDRDAMTNLEERLDMALAEVERLRVETQQRDEQIETLKLHIESLNAEIERLGK
jgi:hypothetical protein